MLPVPASRRERFLVSPSAGISERDAALARLDEPRSGVWPALAALAVLVVCAVPAFLLGVLSAALFNDLVGFVTAALAGLAPPAAVYRSVSAPRRAACRGRRVRARLAPSDVTDLRSPGMTPSRSARTGAAYQLVATARAAATATGLGAASSELLDTIERDAWRVAQLTSTAALLSPSALSELDVEAEHVLSALGDCVTAATASWARCQALVLGEAETPWLTDPLRLEGSASTAALEAERPSRY